MQTYHIHISGLVQGVGFRPFVCRVALEMGITGWVCNSNDGVHIEFNATANTANDFYTYLITHPPANTIITTHSISTTTQKEFDSFTIQASTIHTVPDLLITPDISLCADCKKETLDKNNRRYHYPFTTCLKCGPRYSIMKILPYDRENTTMAHLPMCNNCREEYHDIQNERHFSQTNTCPECAIPMYLYSAKGKLVSSDYNEILDVLDAALKDGKITAVKGIGGYLLLCDATNAKTIETLRQRKHRPAKPFALLYKDIEMVNKDVRLSPEEEIALQEKSAPIVLCRTGNNENKIALDSIAPGLNRIGIMLPYTALLLLIGEKFKKPLIATSGNISGSPVIFRDDEAIEWLGEVADLVLTFDRDIVTPQDDSVIQFTGKGQKIILRRSRGLAPIYFPDPFKDKDECILAMGSELKSAFALYNKGNLLVSQYLGDQASLESQKSFTVTRNHLQQLFQCSPQKILVDKHPAYFVSEAGRTEAVVSKIELQEIQHHKAHFAAVLAENELLNEKGPVLGVIWDGTGYGDDKQIWGGEFFLYQNADMKRVAHLDYFPQLLGDKMNIEPRLSALSLLMKLPEHQQTIKQYFTNEEWKYYQQLIKHPTKLFTSSMGRFLDGIAAMLGICSVNGFEGEAAMRLEAIAQNSSIQPADYYSLPYENGILNWQPYMNEMLEDYYRKEDICFITRKVFSSLAKTIAEISSKFNTEKIAFSGGVFQSTLLTDLVLEEMKGKKQLYFHRQLSPNDECIGFGQLAYYFMQKKTKSVFFKHTELAALSY
jgi:hydrogenase maturation protein HypF